VAAIVKDESILNVNRGKVIGAKTHNQPDQVRYWTAAGEVFQLVDI
jgi:hypothetical protein